MDYFRKTNSFKPELPVHKLSLNVELYAAHILTVNQLYSKQTTRKYGTHRKPQIFVVLSFGRFVRSSSPETN